LAIPAHRPGSGVTKKEFRRGQWGGCQKQRSGVEAKKGGGWEAPTRQRCPLPNAPGETGGGVFWGQMDQSTNRGVRKLKASVGL